MVLYRDLIGGGNKRLSNISHAPANGELRSSQYQTCETFASVSHEPLSCEKNARKRRACKLMSLEAELRSSRLRPA